MGLSRVFICVCVQFDILERLVDCPPMFVHTKDVARVHRLWETSEITNSIFLKVYCLYMYGD
ncbi:hypothetical protein Mapa_006374 [Marchantia paleacea]|nr:hypothetical protein Mapa_006374 [Marchantia paleacea]